MKYCETCKYRTDKGKCTNEKLAEDCWQDEEAKKDMLIYRYMEGGDFWVGPKFGCIHHESVYNAS